MAAVSLKLAKYGVSEWRYRELQYFCYQYKEKKAMAERCLHPSAVRLDREGRGGDVSDPTAAAMIKRERLLADVEAIEVCAKEAVRGNGPVAQALLTHVTRRNPPPVDLLPCGRRQFYEARRRFFVLLDGRRGE